METQSPFDTSSEPTMVTGRAVEPPAPPPPSDSSAQQTVIGGRAVEPPLPPFTPPQPPEPAQLIQRRRPPKAVEATGRSSSSSSC